MAKRRRARTRAKPVYLRTRVGKQVRKHGRSVVVLSAIAAALVAFLMLADPFASPTATDSNGQQVTLGPIDTPGAAPRVGSPAPNFVLADYEGKAVRLEDFRGKVVFLNFWATWCTACEAEMPDMNELAAAHPDDLVILAVNRGERPEQAQRWSDARALENIQFVIDPRESIAGAYRLPNGMPVSFFIDAEGYVTRVVTGAQNFGAMEKAFAEARSAGATSFYSPAP